MSYLTHNQIQLVEETFWMVAHRGNDFVHSFYDRLFAEYPQVVPLFSHADRSVLEMMVMKTMITVVENLDSPGLIVQELERLGQRHSNQYQVQAEHYVLYSATFRKTLAQFCGHHWTAAHNAAWGATFDMMAAIMSGALDGPLSELVAPVPEAPLQSLIHPN